LCSGLPVFRNIIHALQIFGLACITLRSYSVTLRLVISTRRQSARIGCVPWIFVSCNSRMLLRLSFLEVFVGRMCLLWETGVEILSRPRSLRDLALEPMGPCDWHLLLKTAVGAQVLMCQGGAGFAHHPKLRFLYYEEVSIIYARSIDPRSFMEGFV
jgi:hypothetical protein